MRPHPNCILGIDPGQNGGIALIDRKGFLVFVRPMPKTESAIAMLLKEVKDIVSVCIIEAVNPFPGQGIASTGKFMRGYGFLRGLLFAYNIPFKAVQPVKWQRALGIKPRGKKTKVEHKNALKTKAQRLFPTVAVTLKISDSLLIAKYGQENRLWLE